MKHYLAFLVSVCVPGFCAAGQAPSIQKIGDVAEDKGVLTVTGKTATIIIGGGDAAVYRLTAELQLAPAGAGVSVMIMPTAPGDPKSAGLGLMMVSRDRDGCVLLVSTSTFDSEKSQWSKGDRGQLMRNFTFWPPSLKARPATPATPEKPGKPKPAPTTKEVEKAAAAEASRERQIRALAEAGMEERTWQGQWLGLELEATPYTVAVWLNGHVVRVFPRSAGAKGPVAVQLGQGDKLRSIALTAPDPIYLPLDAAAYANSRFDKPFDRPHLDVGGVPFELSKAEDNCLSLRQAEWLGWQADMPWSHESPSPRMLNDVQMPMLCVPTADYVAAHVLAVAEDDPNLTNAFTLRAGRFSGQGNEQNVQFDFLSQAPRRGQAGIVDPKAVVRTPAGPLFHIRVPMTFAFAQDIEKDKPLNIEVTKEVRLARRVPDPCRFRYRPLGLPSGVRIAAITLERSPLQMKVTSSEAAHAFVEPQTPQFRVALENITSAAQDYALAVQATHLDGTKVEADRKSGKVGPGETGEMSISVPVTKRGYYDLAVRLENGRKQTLLCRQTSFALLPPDTRKHRDLSPFGTYAYGGMHYTCGDPDKLGPLHVKLGMRYGMFGPLEARRKYGIIPGMEPRVENYIATADKNPDLPPMGLIFHELTLSLKDLMRVPDVFVDWPPFTLSQKEEASLRKMCAWVETQAKEVKAKHPEVQLGLGNCPLTVQEHFLRAGIAPEAFDSLGNESPSMGHPPESQPPDWLGNNSSLWMDRQMLDAYGYKDKPVSQCHEVCYPGTNPGNLDYQTQADYFVRHALHSLAWRIPAFRPGILMDVGGNYRFSHWGASGFCHSYPEMNVKPSFVEFATMTLVLDGARFVRLVPSGSQSLYVMEFQNADDGSQLFAVWTCRGTRPVNLHLEGPGPWRIMDGQGNETSLKGEAGQYLVTAGTSPVYVRGKGALAAVEPGQPRYSDKPEGKATVLSPLASMDEWTVESGRSPELEYYDFMCPRRKGEFTFEAVAEFEGKAGAIRVTPKPLAPSKPTLAMPMYAVLAHRKGLALSGTPREIGLFIHGNSGWGRVIFELTDASGQRWISIGAQAKEDPNALLRQSILDRFPNAGVSDWNTDDPYGISRINFDGWRYVGFPLPGNYPGEGYHWPANSNWRWDKDGKVHYPLTLKKMVVELNEKVLQGTTYAPVARPEIHLKDLQSVEGDTMKVKTTVAETP